MSRSPKMLWFLGGAVSACFALAILQNTSVHSQSAVPPAPPAQPAAASVANDGKLRIIAFGAHPDDCELKVAGTAMKWAAAGHHVKFVSLTNGDIGHWQSAGGPLAQRRTEEVQRCAKILGIESEVLDIHDGELLPTLEHRKTVTKLIREWKADIVLSHRPNDYHPDHRNRSEEHTSELQSPC